MAEAQPRPVAPSPPGALPPLPAVASQQTVDHVPSTGPEQTQRTPASGLPQVAGYEVLGVLGKGGMGVVYQARHLRLNRVVALKMVLGGAHAGEDELRRFLSEAEALASLQHPNVVQVFDSGQYQGLPYCALEFVPGGSLKDRLV